MPLSHLYVIPCPNGAAAPDIAKVSVFLAPRLREAGTLQDYPLWRDWGANAASLDFRLYRGNAPVPPANAPITVVSPAVDPVVWNTVFGANAQQRANVKVDAFPVIDRSQARFVDADSAGLASGSDTLLRELAHLGAKRPTVDTMREALAKAQLDAALASAHAFVDEIGNGATPGAPDYDFHAILRMASAHPDLMRRLGLVFDLEIDLTNAPAALNEIQIRTNFPNLPPIGAGPALFESHEQVPMRMAIDSDFRPVAAFPQYRDGRFVNFAGGKYAVGQGSTIGYTLAGESLRRQLTAAVDENSVVEPPAVDEAGLRVMHVEITEMVKAQAERSAQIEHQAAQWIQGGNDPDTGKPVLPPVVRAEDATAGIRWDVLDTDTDEFRSLHQRHAPGGYRFPRDKALKIVPADDEGWWTLGMITDGTPVREAVPGATFPPHDDRNPDTPDGQPVPETRFVDKTAWRVNPDMMLWSGWSLSGGRPGQVLDGAGRIIEVSPNEPRREDPAQVAIDYDVVPKSLERLRFAHDYRFRGRFVDLCGNSEPMTASSAEELHSGPVTFGRTLPVPPPTVVRRASRPAPGVGDHTTTIVIKSELEQADIDTAPSQRMMFIPRVAQNRLERHGRPAADGIDVADYSFLVERDANTLADQLLVDPKSGELVAGATIIDDEVTEGALKQRATYLPDVATGQVALHDLPNASNGAPALMPYGRWPNSESVALELIAGTAAPRRSTRDRRVTVSLPKGTTHTCRVSSAIDPGFLPHFKAYQALTPTERAKLESAFTNGQVAAVSPQFPITLVHAVRLPLDPPAFGAFELSRDEVGQTSAFFDGPVTVHGATTDRLVLRSRWTTPDLRFDASGLTLANTGSVVMTDRVVATPATDDGVTTEQFERLAVEFGDTLRHTVTLQAEAFCRYSSYFTERSEVVIVKGTAATLHAGGVARNSVIVKDLATGSGVDLADNFRIDHRAGTITPLDGSELADGTGVEVLYIPLPVSRTTEGGTIELTVPSSAAPRAPEVDHVVPAFKRTVTPTDDSIAVVHDGRVVRVLMRPPWNSSGEGELLGVAVAVDGSLSRWGRDATIGGVGATTQPTVASFPNAVATTPPPADLAFDVAGHEVADDAARNLITADVLVDATFSYRPFVQLHVCRYQPESVGGAHLSPTVTTETMRLGARRDVLVRHSATREVEVTMTGPDDDNTVTVRTQVADPDVADPDLRWLESGAPVVLTRTGTTDNATFAGTVPLPASTTRRLIIEDAEDTDVAYREVIEIPADW